MKYLSLLAVIICSFSVSGQCNFIGSWDTKEDNTIIVISESEGNILGKIESSANPKAVVGKVILKDLKPNGNSWKGTIYAAKRKQWYDAVVTLNESVLEIEIQVGFFSKTIEWIKH